MVSNLTPTNKIHTQLFERLPATFQTTNFHMCGLVKTSGLKGRRQPFKPFCVCVFVGGGEFANHAVLVCDKGEFAKHELLVCTNLTIPGPCMST
jgi:hypothetical protein